MDSLFPTLPKKLTALSDKELNDLLAEHEEAAGLIDSDDSEFLGDLSADEIIAQYESGAEAILMLRGEIQARSDAAEAFVAKKAELRQSLKAEAEETSESDEEEEEGAEETSEADESTEAEDETEATEEETAEEAETEAREVVLVASAEEETKEAEKPRLRRAPVPAPAADRVVVTEAKKELSFVASAGGATPPGTKFESREEIVAAMISMMGSLGSPEHVQGGKEVKHRVASLNYIDNFPDDRRLHKSDWVANGEKIGAIGSPFFGPKEMEALVASGGLCAPLEPIYTMPQLATADTPAWDSLPRFRAERGGVNVPTPTTIGDADGSVTTITEAMDAAGGSLATKACLDMECPDYTETAVTIISACREFGNLNAMAWPEKIAHELELTRAFHSRTLEGYILDQIKGLSVNVTNGADTLGALIYLVEGITEAAYGIRSRLRLPREARFQALLPAVVLDMLLLDTVSTQFDRYRTRGDIDAYLGSAGIDVTYYLDTPSTGTSQIADSEQGATTLDGFPDVIQWAIFPQGTFLGVDMAELNLGIVRDSTLNSTNDFQVFWETFQNVARIGPAQAAYWVTTDICPTGAFPSAGTTRTCESDIT